MEIMVTIKNHELETQFDAKRGNVAVTSYVSPEHEDWFDQSDEGMHDTLKTLESFMDKCMDKDGKVICGLDLLTALDTYLHDMEVGEDFSEGDFFGGERYHGWMFNDTAYAEDITYNEAIVQTALYAYGKIKAYLIWSSLQG